MANNSDGILRIPIRIAHEKLGLSPNQLSTIGFIIGTGAAFVIVIGNLVGGLVLLAISQIIDGLDGGVARRYRLQSAKGQMLETIYDRLNELMIFLALAYVGHVTYFMAVLAFVAIILVTIVEPLSKFDPGFKRFMIYFGYLATVVFHVQGFQMAMHVIFFANLIAFIVGTIMVDYRLQKDIDTQAIIRREREITMGIPQPPDDPPSFLSKLFS
ncbi:MAG: CDP-alcohol phosphatidyltransferase family protein [Ignavibacteria bacterium]|nr:CDP-alcohol phosphatidyltransferase family protein [Ignavibacteria bacterium]MBI3765658.1 CDP-alcohol phosphatidyltransferase family protein [Ignavibacteriales bacterium]